MRWKSNQAPSVRAYRRENSNNNHRLHRRRPITNPEEGVGGGETIADNKNKIDAASARIGRFSPLFPESSFTASSRRAFFFIPFYFPTRRVGCSSVNGSKRRRVDASTETVKLPALFLTFRPLSPRRKSASRRCAQFFQNSLEFSSAPACKTWKIGQRRRDATPPFLRDYISPRHSNGEFPRVFIPHATN